MPRIRLLDSDVVNKIAAGEVIERPGSVVKELLENAVDAGATRIQVDVEQGGTELIRVVDNGCGIDPEDMKLAFASHATSKLVQPDDLWAIRSMGFRGEALASIGSVAKVLLQSYPAEATQGAEILDDGGKLCDLRPWNGNPGTRIEVRNLFFNVPARRKFLRTIGTEMGHITEAFTRIALGFPHIHLKLTHNGKLVYDIPPSATLADRIVLFFGEDLRDKLMPIERAHTAVKLSGLIAAPSIDRGNARLQYLFLNGRCIRDRTLAHAIQESYHGLLMVGRYAVAFLFMEMSPDHVDVNVHPTKAEVRFRDSQGLHHFVLTSVREKLRNSDLTAAMKAPPAIASVALPTPAAPQSASPVVKETDNVGSPPEPLPTNPGNGRGAAWELPSILHEPNATRSQSEGESAAVPSIEVINPTCAPSSQEAGKPVRALQLHNAYLVVETNHGMLVIDQHALHERILFEELKTRLLAGSLEVQRLLIPEPVDLPPDQAAAALEHQEALAKLGLEVQDFGHGTILVMTYPTFLAKHPPAKLLRKVTEHLSHAGKTPSLEILMNDVLSLMACHAAIKAGDPLGEEEIAALVARRDLVTDTHHCPHGRPTSLYFSKHELERQFQRV